METISWTSFLLWALAAFVVYYAAVVGLYYRDVWKPWLSGKRRPQHIIKNRTNEQAPAVTAGKAQGLAAPDDEPFTDIAARALSCLDEVKSLCVQLKAEGANKERWMERIGKLLQKYPDFRDSYFRGVINNAILMETTGHAQEGFDQQDQDRWWRNEGVC